MATSWQAAKLTAATKKQSGKRVSIAEVGTVEGETLARQLAVAVNDHGATGVFLTEDGQENHFFQAPPVPDDD